MDRNPTHSEASMSTGMWGIIKFGETLSDTIFVDMGPVLCAIVGFPLAKMRGMKLSLFMSGTNILSKYWKHFQGELEKYDGKKQFMKSITVCPYPSYKKGFFNFVRVNALVNFDEKQMPDYSMAQIVCVQEVCLEELERKEIEMKFQHADLSDNELKGRLIYDVINGKQNSIFNGSVVD